MSKVIKEKVVIQEQRQEKIIEELDTEVVRRLNDIRGMMDRAHVLLKHTSLVMKFDGKTTSSPLPPRAVQRQTRALNFLMYLKPEKPERNSPVLAKTIIILNYNLQFDDENYG